MSPPADFGSQRPYTPTREDPAALAMRTVGRDRVLDRIHKGFVSASKTGSRPHTLLIGPRGSGKSHVVEVATDVVRTDRDLSTRFAVVNVPEDVVGFTRFDDLLEWVVRDLGTGHAARRAPASERIAAISELLGGRVLLLTIENLDRFMAAMGIAGQRAFRSWVETSGEVLILATTPLYSRRSRNETCLGTALSPTSRSKTSLPTRVVNSSGGWRANEATPSLKTS